MEQKYILVQWPQSQLFMEHPRFDECYLVQPLEHQPQYSSAYFIPEDLYEELKVE